MFTHTRSRSRDGAGAKSALQEMGPTPNFLYPFQNCAHQSYFCPQRHRRSAQVAPPSTHLCMNMAMVAQREYQNPPISTCNPSAHVWTYLYGNSYTLNTSAYWINCQKDYHISNVDCGENWLGLYCDIEKDLLWYILGKQGKSEDLIAATGPVILLKLD